MTAHIFYSYYLDSKGEHVTIGGVQTYLTNLSELLMEMGYEVVFYQQAESDFEREHNGCKVIGVKGHSDRGYVTGQRLFDKCKEVACAAGDIIIFGTDTLNVPCPGFKTISIQHGIYWDVPQKGELSKQNYLKEFCRKAMRAWKQVKRVSCVDSIVCVDYNFINWYRAVVPYPQTRLKGIMNFTDIPDANGLDKPQDKVNVIFARRLVEYRGTRIFTEAVQQILARYQNVFVTIAGNGPDEQWMKSRLGSNNRVEFITYSSDESLKIHADKHIAVVPTVGSEGTSLSLLEAMACGCAVVCSNVGGMTNIVQSGYNGLMIEPTADALYTALENLISNHALCSKIGEAARLTVMRSFSKERWRAEWREVIIELQRKDKENK